jgi:hypothetical protein
MGKSSLATVQVEEVVSVPKRIISRIRVSGRAISAGKTLSVSDVRKAVADAARAHGKKHARA